jgi:hypothetical protein
MCIASGSFLSSRRSLDLIVAVKYKDTGIPILPQYQRTFERGSTSKTHSSNDSKAILQQASLRSSITNLVVSVEEIGVKAK